MIDKIPYGTKHTILYANNVFELRANNIGLRHCSTEYAILVQDDMLILEENWDLRLIKPVLAFDDIWAVTSRGSFNLKSNGDWYNIKESAVGHLINKNSILPRNKCYVGQLINRALYLLKWLYVRKKIFLMNHYQE